MDDETELMALYDAESCLEPGAMLPCAAMRSDGTEGTLGTFGVRPEDGLLVHASRIEAVREALSIGVPDKR